MMTQSLQQHKQSKYKVLYRRVARAIQDGRFYRYTKQKQQALYQRLQRYEQQLKHYGIATASVTALFVAPIAATAQTPVGSEFKVNSYTTNSQLVSSVAMDSDGDFVVAWMSFGQDGNRYGIYGQRYNSNGVAQGSEFIVNSYTTDYQSIPSVAMDSDGDFVVTWYSNGQDGDGYGVYGQRYNSSGVAQGGEFQVNTYTTRNQRNPSVAMDSDGDFVITWHSRDQDGDGDGIYARRYDNSGVAKDMTEFQVNTYTTNTQLYPRVAIDSDGDFVVTWESYGQDGNSFGIYGQRYNSSGVAQGGEFQVNTYTTNYQTFPSVAMDSDGDFVVAWQSYLQDGDLYGIYAQRYNSSGVAQGVEFQVNTYTTNYQIYPSVAMDSDGDFVVAWESYLQDGDYYGIYAQQYNSSGVAQGVAFQVNTYTTNIQRLPSVTMDGDGDFVVAWQSYLQDGDYYGIYMQRYSPVIVPVELTFFKGQATKAGNLLTWQTASELNNEGFHIERSSNAKDWKAIGFVQGNGTTVETQDYSFLDDAPVSDIQYYRLKQLDFDGQFEYSDIIVINDELRMKNEALVVFPNPVQERLTIVNGQGAATLYNALGQVVQQFQIVNAQFEMEVSGLPQGIYTLQVRRTDGTVLVQQVVK